MIIHISGSSGSGKTTLGNKIKNRLGDKVIVKDLDDLLFEFVMMKEKSKQRTSTILKNWKNDYQKYIDEFIEKQKKPIIFVGLNTDLGSLGFRNNKLTPPKAFYNVYADYIFYIDLPLEQILQQKFFRQTQKICDNKEKLFKKWLLNPTKTQLKLNYDINLNLWKYESEKWNKLYKTKKYIFEKPDNIYNMIIEIIQKI